MRDLDRRIINAFRDHRRNTGVELNPADAMLVIHPDDWAQFLRLGPSSIMDTLRQRRGHRDEIMGVQVITSVHDVEPGIPELQFRWSIVI